MRKVKNLEGQVKALSNLAKAYESLANMTKACESLDRVSPITSLCIIVNFSLVHV